ncbi:Kunitz-type serine protease inhibitor bitisilin-3 [Holothuria leucospilota]|uniref:Kunitz-type serine protease inhibitor bitisilin-3 n=1 Tax=Holothuria leucospilota TaxID=206669 RepID=A0A9Q1H966_HOLLE|nr:Kunitz-type serine protease inhibitor bitisilin-3 [Holothuria leucospilota]
MKLCLVVFLTFLVGALTYRRRNIAERALIAGGGTKDICRIRPKVGPCKAAVKRWYYSNAEKQCKPFIYGGCDGNKNNFISRQDCQLICRTNRPMFCLASAEYGPCNGRVRRWFFNRKSKRCEIFLSSGCKANRNYFLSRSTCSSTCKAEY